MSKQEARPRFYVSCTRETFELVQQIAQALGVKPSVAAVVCLSTGAQLMSRSLQPEKFGVTKEFLSDMNAMTQKHGTVGLATVQADVEQAMAEEAQPGKKPSARKKAAAKTRKKK
jgi:hypothetical protein